jgi:hypothetical protein
MEKHERGTCHLHSKLDLLQANSLAFRHEVQISMLEAPAGSVFKILSVLKSTHRNGGSDRMIKIPIK